MDGAQSRYLDRGFRFEQGGLLERALESYRDALAASETPVEEAEAHLRIARVYRAVSNWEESNRSAARAIEMAERAGVPDLVAEAMNIEVGSLQVQGYFDESISCFRKANYDLGLAIGLGNVARAALDRGDVERAIELGEEAIGLARRVNALDLLLTGVQNQAAAFAATGRYELAEGLLTEALGHFTSAGNLVRQAECLEIMGDLSAQRPEGGDTVTRCFKRALVLATRANDHRLMERLSRRLAEGAGEAHAEESRPTPRVDDACCHDRGGSDE